MIGAGEEFERLAALRSLRVLDTPAELEFDLVTRLAASVFDVPISLLSLVDSDRQWFKSRYGLSVRETNRSLAFCSRAIEQEGVFEIPSATADARFCDNALVTRDPHVRYYAGAPLTLKSGHRVGTLCIIDTKARVPLAPKQRRLLQGLAEIVTVQLEQRRLQQNTPMSIALAEAAADAIIAADARGLITEWNSSAERMFGYSRAEAIGVSLCIIIPPELRHAHSAVFQKIITGGAQKLIGKTLSLPAMRRGGELFPVELSIAAWNDASGNIGGVGAIIRDVSERKALEVETDKTQRFLDTVLEQLPAMLFVKDASTREYLFWNKAAEAATGLSREQVLGHTDVELFGEIGEQFMKRDEVTLRTSLPRSFESRFLRPDGEHRVLRTRRIAVADESDLPQYLLGISEDVTEWRKTQDELLFLTGHDPLTQLKNRVSFGERLSVHLAEPGEFAVLIADLDRFRAFNNQHGQHVGDLLLQAFARLVRDCLGPRPDCFAARLSADDFAILLTGERARTRATRLADGLLAGLKSPLDLEGLKVSASASIGIAVASEQRRDALGIMADADVALQRAKAEGRSRYCFFEPAMDQAARERGDVEAKLSAAIESDAIYLHYQPLASLETGQVVAFEALARWHDPSLGDVRPDVFVPIAEDCGLIGALGSKVLRMAIAEASRWTPQLGVAVNLTPAQVQDPDFPGEVSALLDEFNFSPGRLELEVTEGVMIRDTEAALGALRKLKALGVSIAMDDFGTGYSSLSYFRLFPFDKIKLDQSFVREMGTSQEALAIVHAVIGLARGLGLPVVAEGVENIDQFNMLLAEGCTQVQGYLLGRPAPIEAFLGSVIRSRSLDEGAKNAFPVVLHSASQRHQR